MLFLVLPALAADIDGKWKGQIEGADEETVFQLKAEGSSVTGWMSGPGGQKHSISKGELKADELSLTIASEWQGSPITLLFKGKISGSEIKGTLGTEGGEWSTDLVLKKAAD